jgi:hypothetical protein
VRLVRPGAQEKKNEIKDLLSYWIRESDAGAGRTIGPGEQRRNLHCRESRGAEKRKGNEVKARDERTFTTGAVTRCWTRNKNEGNLHKEKKK